MLELLMYCGSASKVVASLPISLIVLLSFRIEGNNIQSLGIAFPEKLI
jgi:hypothetical protein